MTNHTTHNPLGWIEDSLADLEKQGLRRKLSIRGGRQADVIDLDGRCLVNFGSNDYLGLAADPRLAMAVADALDGWGAGASPLVSGHAALHRDLENRLAEFEGSEAALLCTSGFAANSATIAAVVGPGDVVFTDRKNHASLFDGCRLSRANVRVYPHRDHRRLDRLMRRATDYRRRLIVTDSLFSMDGDVAPLAELAEVARRHDAMLMVDEAHATGVFGDGGRGICEQLGVEEEVHIRVGTLSKALGSIGGFVAGSRPLIDWFLNRGRPYIYSTAQPAAVAAAGCAALEIVRKEPHRRLTLLSKAESFRAELVSQGWNIGASTTQIVPIIVGDARRALDLSAALGEAGFFVPAIRPPTVPQDEACLRISLSFGHGEGQIAGLIEALDSHRVRP